MPGKEEGRPAGDPAALGKRSNPTTNSMFIVPDPWAWRALAETAILELATTGQPFDSADVRALGVPEPADHHWWGTVYSGLHRRGLICLVGFTVSPRISLRGTAVRRWRGSARLLADEGDVR